jgi:hypothetical protein
MPSHFDLRFAVDGVQKTRFPLAAMTLWVEARLFDRQGWGFPELSVMILYNSHCLINKKFASLQVAIEGGTGSTDVDIRSR